MTALRTLPVPQLEALVDPLWDALLRVRRQTRKAQTPAEVRELVRARRELRQRIRRLNDRIEALLLADAQLLGGKRAATALRRVASDLRQHAGRIRGVRSALDRVADLLRLADHALELLV